MKQNEILEILGAADIIHYLDEISQIHMYTKHYLLVAEEISEEGMTFLQPLKEHRDAYDHLMRIFALSIKNNEPENIHDYILDNVKKAYGHEYRAFFDTADWFTYICRKYVREELTLNSVKKKYDEAYEDFDSLKEFINEVPFKVAKFREDKDISNEEPILKEVLEYKNLLDKLLEYYKRVRLL